MVQVLAGLPVSPQPTLAVFLVFFSIYSFDRVAAEPEVDALNHPERTRFARRNARQLLTLAITAYGLALLLSASGGPRRVLAVLLPMAALLVYSFPFVPRPLARRWGFRRLKEIFVVKNAVVACTFATTLTLVPLPAQGAPAMGPLVALWVFIFVRFFINAAVFDIRDEVGDRQHGIRTLPVVLGRARAVRVLQALNLALGVFLLAVPLLGLGPPACAALAVLTPYSVWYLRKLLQPGPLHFLCDVVVDGELYVAGAAVLLTLSLA
jgi:4-hydroxybenzoate polyprenyltransferase